MVAYLDGSVIAQMGNPDMKTPIAYCLAWPERIEAGVKPLDFYQLAGLEFEQPDFERFPCLALAVEAIKIGKSAPCILNAANEIAVDAFLNEKIKFTQIALIIKRTLSRSSFEELTNLEQIIQSDKNARALALVVIQELD
jgi:1-deoxy-D-xylulose-5-phosphate reductoisomerase